MKPRASTPAELSRDLPSLFQLKVTSPSLMGGIFYALQQKDSPGINSPIVYSFSITLIFAPLPFQISVLTTPLHGGILGEGLRLGEASAAYVA